MYFSNKDYTLHILYNFGIFIVEFILKFLALFNHKIKLGVQGRANTLNILKSNITKQDKTLWFHCASLGEYEQGLPVFKELRKFYTTHKIVLSFFSPSGYQIRKHTDIADLVVYLPIDTPKNAKQFLDIVNPELTLFVKYDIWPNYLKEIHKRQGRALLISALFRENQSYFKFYGGFLRKSLLAFEHIFTQDENSKHLLNTINYYTVTVSGDTRFDRVYSQLSQNNTLEFIKAFKGEDLCFVAGSTWPEDDAILIDFINNTENAFIKYIIVPHNITSNQIQKLKRSITKKTILFSEMDNSVISNYQVLIIDTIGLLSKIYSYANIAYVGGAMGNTGLHNTLEPAVFGVPIIIGNNHNKFPEAKKMIENGGMFEINNSNEFHLLLNKLTKNKEKLELAGAQNFNFIKKNTGAVIQIMDYIRI